MKSSFLSEYSLLYTILYCILRIDHADLNIMGVEQESLKELLNREAMIVRKRCCLTFDYGA